MLHLKPEKRAQGEGKVSVGGRVSRVTGERKAFGKRPPISDMDFHKALTNLTRRNNVT